jgi:AbrB family looped-hinge helix DNA binding protein
MKYWISVFMGETKKPTIYGTVKVGDRGQIVIPAQARKEFNINPGDQLLILTGKNRRGLALIKADLLREFADRIIKGLEEDTT